MSSSSVETATHAEPSLPGWLMLLGCLTAVAPLSIDMYLPAFPRIQDALHASAGSMEYTLSSFFMGATLGQLFFGPLSDRYGRKRPLLIGFAVFVMASIGCALSDTVTALNFWRFVQGVGGCSGIVISNTVVRDRTVGKQAARAFAMLILVMGVAPILAPLVGGGLLAIGGWRWIFGALALFGGACLVAIAFGLEETHRPDRLAGVGLRQVMSGYATVCASHSFLGFALSGAFAMAGMFAYIAGSPFVLIDIFGIAPSHYGLYFALNAVGLITASQVNGLFLRRHGPSAVLRAALWMPFLGGLALLAASLVGISLPVFMLGSFVVITSIGWIMPNAMASALTTHGQTAGSAAALIGAMQYLLATLVGAGVGLLHDGSVAPLALVMAICGCAAWLSHRLLVRRTVVAAH